MIRQKGFKCAVEINASTLGSPEITKSTDEKSKTYYGQKNKFKWMKNIVGMHYLQD